MGLQALRELLPDACAGHRCCSSVGMQSVQAMRCMEPHGNILSCPFAVLLLLLA